MTKSFLTVTLNPAIDRTVEVEELRLGEVVRGRLLLLEPAGKGVNAARTLAALGGDVLATGFVGKGEAPMFRKALREDGADADFVQVQGVTRMSITLIDLARGQDTHIAEAGFPVSRAQVRALLSKAGRAAKGADWASVNGRPATGVSAEDCARLVRTLKDSGANVLVDTSGEFLAATVEAGADAIKPNDEELAELAGRRLESESDILQAAREVARKVRFVVVSLGAKGAMCVTRRGAWLARETEKAQVVHTVGCGDALAMGFMFGMAKKMDVPQALRLAVACGGACVRTARASVGERGEVDAVLGGVEVEELGGLRD